MVKNLTACTAFILVWLVYGGAVPDQDAIIGLAMSGVLGFAIGDALFFGSAARCGVQVAGVVGQLNVPLAGILAWAFLGEDLSMQEVLSMLLVLSGASLVILDKPAAKASTIGKKRHGVYLALACAVCTAVANVLGHGSMEGVEVVPSAVTRLGAGVLGAFVISMLMDIPAGLSGKPNVETASLVKPFRHPEILKLLFCAALISSVINLLPYHFALRELRGGISSALFATMPLFTLPIGRVFGERHGWRAVLGTLIGFVGVAGILSAS
jgi:drug/metabolite transporter (DMT)-like permease